jgi:hypothetical protein
MSFFDRYKIDPSQSVSDADTGESHKGDRPDGSIPFTGEMDEKVTAFCQKYIVLAEVLYRDKELRQWCMNHSSYRSTEMHSALENTIFSMASEIGNIGFYGQVLSSKDYGKYALVEALDGTKADLMYGIFLEIRLDYSDGNYLIPQALAKGRLYRLMKAYLEYDAKEEGARGFQQEFFPIEEFTDDIRNRRIVYIRNDVGYLWKIDKEKHTGYRFDPDKKEWNEIRTLYIEYEYGELQGREVWIDDVFKTGDPFRPRPS